jgi:chromosome segregation ATPase
MEDRSPEAFHCDDEVAPEPTTEVVDTRKSSIEMALNAVNRRLAQVNAALTELQAASERRATTVRMLERINADWDELDAKLRDLAQATVDHDRWTRKPVERAYARLHGSSANV